MTTPALPPPPNAVPPIPVVTAQSGSRLEQLAAEYERAHTAASSAKKILEDVVNAIKVELTNAQPGQPKVDFHSTALEKPLRMTAVTSWRVNTDKLKAEHPLVYVACARQGTTWKLGQVSG